MYPDDSDAQDACIEEAWSAYEALRIQIQMNYCRAQICYYCWGDPTSSSR